LKILPTLTALAVLAALLLGLRWMSRGRAAGDERLPVVVSQGFPLRLRQTSGAELEIPAPPRRVLPANAAWVDFLTLLVGPERVLALPSEAFGYSRLTDRDREWSALPVFTGLDAERCLAMAPDLVLAHTWQSPEMIDTLRRAAIPVLVVSVPASWEEIERTLDLLATVLDVPERARELEVELASRRAALARRARPFAELRALTYTNLGAGGWTTGTGTTADVLLSLAGLHNAAAEAGFQGDVPADGERLLALDPDLFVVGRPDRSEVAPPSATFLLAEPALRSLQAVRAQRIVALSPALFTTASPELLRGAEAVIDELERMALVPREPVSAGAAPGSPPGGG